MVKKKKKKKKRPQFNIWLETTKKFGLALGEEREGSCSQLVLS
jgi:hypothetical protein